MKLFQLIEKPFGILGIYPPKHSNENPLTFRRIAASFGEYANSFYISATAMLKVCTYIPILYKLNKIYDLIQAFETAIHTRFENPISRVLYEDVSKKIEKRTKITWFLFIVISLPGIMLPNFFSSYYKYYIVDPGGDHFSLAFPVWFPFDSKTPIGYLFAFCVEFISFFFVLHSCTCVVSFLVGSCDLLTSFSTDLKADVYALDIQYRAKGYLTRLGEFVQFHSTSKELVYEFNECFATIITFYYIWSIITVTSTLLVTQMAITHDSAHIIEMIRPLILMFWSFSHVYLISDLGENVSNGFSELDEAICSRDWYTFPIEVQRILPTIILAVQKPVVLRGFGNIPCLRETFRRSLKSGFSYYMVLWSIE